MAEATLTNRLTIALAQINPTVGDVPGNLAKVQEARRQAGAADLVVFPELALSGYPPEDLVLKDAFLDRVKQAVLTLAAQTADGGPAVLVGAPWRVEGRRHNAQLLLDDGSIAAVVLKHHLPNYGVFDEVRVFTPGPLPRPVPFRGVNLGIMICEDMWYADVAAALRQGGADLLLIPNGSPFELDKTSARHTRALARVAETGLPLVYLNQICGQDELVFDGSSFELDRSGALLHQLPAWEETVAVTEWHKDDAGWACAPGQVVPQPERLAGIYQAMVLGLRDYVTKSRFKGVLLGLSGGIDSALSAAVAVDALGADKVWCVMMP